MPTEGDRREGHRDSKMNISEGTKILFKGKVYEVHGPQRRIPYKDREGRGEYWWEVPVITGTGRVTTIGVLDPRQVTEVCDEEF